MTLVAFDTSVLTSWYDARAGLSAGANGSTRSASKAAAKDPTPPWSTTSTAPKMRALVQSVMAGQKFIDPTGSKLDAPGAGQSGDYKQLFALYQGLNALEGLAEQAGAKTTGPTQLASIQKRFAAGLAEVKAHLDSAPYSEFDIAQGTVAASAKTRAGVQAETDVYATRTLFTGQPADAVPAFQGPTQFSLTATKTGGAQTTVAFDLAEMGATPRTMGDVVVYLNGKLADAGLGTRFANVRIEGAAQTIVSKGKTLSTGATAPPSFSLQIKGTSAEALSFSAPDATPAVYLTQTSGMTTAAKTDAVRQLVKLNADPALAPAQAKVFQANLGPQVAAARASVTGADGSLYLLADVTAATADGQAIKGAQDVALIKYDSAGTLVFSRTLGAADNASGYALSLSADGTKVAVAGAVTGALDKGDAGADPAASDSFVSVYDTKLGEEQWTARRGATGADQPSAVAFGADGSVYVSGVTQSAMPGAAAVGGQDAYLQGFTATGAAKFAVQYGTAGVDKAAGIAVSGSSVMVAGVEDGHAVVRRYDLQATGAPTLGAVRDLGSLQGGEVAGVSVAADGSVIVAGSTHNGVLDAGAVTRAYDGGRDGFIAKLSASLAPGADERLTYIGGDGDRTVSGLASSGGQVWLTGQVATTPPPGQASAFDGYAMSLDAATGATGWSGTVTGLDRLAAPSSIAVAQTGASTLDRLGLPQGKIDYARSATLVADTSLRAGDQFFVSPGGGRSAQAVTIEATDTLDTLATKIGRASGFNAQVAVTTVSGVRTLKITPVNGRSSVELRAGPSGRDALGALGLAEGVVQTATTATPKVGDPKAQGKSYGLGLPSTLDLSDADSIKRTQAALMASIAAVRGVYKDMTTDVAAPTKAAGAVPQYLTNQIASYQAALARLTGSS